MKKRFTEHAIHLFRIDFKKLRAFVRLLRAASPRAEQLKIPHRFKKMYSIAGNIRDVQLTTKLLRKNISIEGRKLSRKIHSLEHRIKHFAAKKKFCSYQA